MVRRVVNRAVLAALLLVVSATGASAAADQPAAWEPLTPFTDGPMNLATDLAVESAGGGRALAVYARDSIERSCDQARARLLEPDGGWVGRRPFRSTEDSRTVLVAGHRLAVVSLACDGRRAQLRYSQRARWADPASVDTVWGSYQVGMNRAGTVALAHRSDRSVVPVHLARPGTGWTALGPIPTPGPAQVDGVAVTRDDEVVVVWRIQDRSWLSVGDADGWTSTRLPGRFETLETEVAANDDGTVAIARRTAAYVMVSVRHPDGTITEPDELLSACDLPYDCFDVEVDRDGGVVMAWTGRLLELLLGRRDPLTGEWRTTELHEQYADRTVRLDTAPSGSVVVADTSEDRVAICDGVERCSWVAFPPNTDHGAFAAGARGTVVAVAGDLSCDDWCYSTNLGGTVRSPERDDSGS